MPRAPPSPTSEPAVPKRVLEANAVATIGGTQDQGVMKLRIRAFRVKDHEEFQEKVIIKDL